MISLQHNERLAITPCDICIRLRTNQCSSILWISDKCEKLSDESGTGESPTGFKSALLRYLKFYEVSAVQQFITAIQKSDMSKI